MVGVINGSCLFQPLIEHGLAGPQSAWHNACRAFTVNFLAFEEGCAVGGGMGE